MYQRKAHMKPAAIGPDRVTTTVLVKFFKAAKEDLSRRGLSDEAFRFEMLEEYFRNDYRGDFEYKGSILGF